MTTGHFTSSRLTVFESSMGTEAEGDNIHYILLEQIEGGGILNYYEGQLSMSHTLVTEYDSDSTRDTQVILSVMWYDNTGGDTCATKVIEGIHDYDL